MQLGLRLFLCSTLLWMFVVSDLYVSEHKPRAQTHTCFLFAFFIVYIRCTSRHPYRNAHPKFLIKTNSLLPYDVIHTTITEQFGEELLWITLSYKRKYFFSVKRLDNFFQSKLSYISIKSVEKWTINRHLIKKSDFEFSHCPYKIIKIFKYK